MRRLHYIAFLLTAALALTACSDDDNSTSTVKDGPAPKMELTVSPESGLTYGGVVTLSGKMTDERNLESYTVYLLNSKGDTMTTKRQMLLGQTFHVDDNIQIPLPQNAVTDNLTLHVVLDNTRNGETVQDFTLSNVVMPDFKNLNLILANGKIVTMVKSDNGETFETPTEVLFAAGIKGIISTTTSKTGGLYWGTLNGDIATMTRDSLTIGQEVEASYKVYFNPRTFELTFGDRHIWTPITGQRSYYIVGTISGDWRDGEITTDKQKMLMTGYQSGDDRYYTWTAPAGDDPETGMWGSTAAGVFRIKLAGIPRYILWDGSKIVQQIGDDKSKSFPLTAGGAFTIQVNFTGSECTSVEVSGDGKSVIFSNDGVIANGFTVTPTVDFGGTQLALKDGTSYQYEGTLTLTKGQTLTSALGLSAYTTNGDLFGGQGNNTWTLTAPSDQYRVRFDAFNHQFYACPKGGYPNFIYMDGWSWSKNSAQSAVVWSPSNQLPLVNVGNYVYEATFYDWGWGGDVKLRLNDVAEGGDEILLPVDNVTPASVISTANDFLLPAASGTYKIRVTLTGGVDINGTTVTPRTNDKFKIEFIAQ